MWDDDFYRKPDEEVLRELRCFEKEAAKNEILTNALNEPNRLIKRFLEGKFKEDIPMAVDEFDPNKALEDSITVSNALWHKYRAQEELEKRKEEKLDDTDSKDYQDKVEKQDYYYRNGVEVKDVIDTVFKFFGSDLSSWESTCIYNILKYLMRYKYKEDPEKDLDKLQVNVEWLKTVLAESD